MFWSSNKNKNTVSCMLDLRSSSIGYALVERNTAISLVKFFDRKHIFFEKISDHNLYTKEFYKNLKEILNKNFLSDHKLRDSVDEINILLGSPWYDSKFKNVSVANTNFKITKKYLQQVVEQSIEEDKNKVEIERIVSNFSIDGYEVQEPIDKKFNKFEFSVYESFVTKEVHAEIVAIIKDLFNKTKINFYTHPTVVNSSIKTMYPALSNYMTFDVGGEITEINIISNNKITNCFYIPNGTHSCVRDLMTHCGYNSETAISKLSMMIENHLDSSCSIKEQELYNNFTNSWLSSIKNLLDEQKITSTPSNIFILADQEVKNVIKEAIDKPEGYAGSLKNNLKPQTRILDYDQDTGSIKFQEGKKRDATLNIFFDFIRIHSR